MSVIRLSPESTLSVGGGQVGLWRPLAIAGGPAPEGASTSLIPSVPGLLGWWDAATLAGFLDLEGRPVTSWREPIAAIKDLSGGNEPLYAHATSTTDRMARAVPRLSGYLGGAGLASESTGLIGPRMDPDLGFRLDRTSFAANLPWTWFLVWSRPNRRHDSGRDTDPVTLLSVNGTPILQADSNAVANRLVLFPSSQPVVLTNNLARRHTHSLILRHTPSRGVDVWLDDAYIVQAAANPLAVAPPGGPVLLLHDGTGGGGAQCWFHEAAEWSGAISDAEVEIVLAHARRWTRGPRKGIVLVVNGQSNAINYALNDGAGALLAEGVAWHVGALGYKLLASAGNPTSYTMQSGHGIYQAVAGTYPGSFLQDPMDESDPATWSLGADGRALRQAITSLDVEDMSELCAIIWPWNETDSLREYNELGRFTGAARRLLGLIRAMVGRTPDRLPLIWWSAIPYGTDAGMIMHRQAASSLARDPTTGVVLGNLQTADSNPRGSVWNPTTGDAIGGDPAHRDSEDNRRFARLATPIVARAILKAGLRQDSIELPTALPAAGGPRIIQASLRSGTELHVTIEHDAGNDLVVPRQAAGGKGFAVMDGGANGAPGAIIPATSCERVDATHLLIRLARAPENNPEQCALFYPYGSTSIGRGNAVTDNYSQRPRPAGWDILSDLGPSWNLDYPLAATNVPVPLTSSSS